MDAITVEPINLGLVLLSFTDSMTGPVLKTIIVR